MSEPVPYYRLNRDVEVVRRDNSLLLVSSRSGSSVRVSPTAEPLLALLQTGAALSELQVLLERLHPQAHNVGNKVLQFLDPLLRLGLLSQGEPDQIRAVERHGWRRIDLFHPDAVAQRVARQVLRLPATLRRALLVALLLATIAGLIQLALLHRFPSGRLLVNGFSPLGLLLFVLLVVPFHEAAHALACRMAGAEVGVGGIIFHGGLIPGPFIETTQAYKVANRWKRFSIPAAGPLVNFLSTGLAAWLLLLWPMSAELQGVLAFILAVGLLFVYVDTNPFGPTDGSHMLEALLDDELARRNAWSFRPLRPGDLRNARRYRIATIAHALLGSMLLYLWLA